MARRNSPLARGIERSEPGGYSASRLTKDRDVIRIATKGRDVLLYPGKGSNLIKQTEIGAPLSQEEEAVHAQAIVDSDAYHPVAREAAAIIRWYRARPIGERAAMNPDHHWQSGLAWIGRPYIEVQTVLTGDGRLRQKDIERWEIRWLGDGRAIGERVAHAIPRRDRLRWLKASRPER